MKYNFIACCLFASLLGAGCTAETEFSDTPAAGQLSVILQPAGLQGTVATTDDKRMNDVKAFRFDDGQLQETYGPLVPGDDGRCYLNLADNRGTLYFLANASQVTALEALVPDATTLDDFLAFSASTSDMTEHGLLMSGREELGSQSASELPPPAALPASTSNRPTKVHSRSNSVSTLWSTKSTSTRRQPPHLLRMPRPPVSTSSIVLPCPMRAKLSFTSASSRALTYRPKYWCVSEMRCTR